MGVRSVSFALALSMVALSGSANAQDGNNQGFSPPVQLVQRGFDISPVPMSQLNFTDQNAAMVGFGSYLVNAVAVCSGCHSFPQFLVKGDTAGSNPAAGDPYTVPPQQSTSAPLVANYNVLHYLAGGQCFGPFMARNLTPEEVPGGMFNGLPEGLTEAEFITVLRTGEDIHCEKEPSDPICTVGPPTPGGILEVMPWPIFHNMTDTDLQAIYAYLTALPHAEPCNTPANGCPAAGASYAYANTADCPKPAPPQ